MNNILDIRLIKSFLIMKARELYLILITKSEAEYIRKNLPDTHITITNRQHTNGRKRYYMEENYKAMEAIRKLRCGTN